MEKPEEAEPQGHQYFIESDEKLAILRLRGQVTLKSILAAAEAIYSDERYDPQFDAIIDIQTTDLALNFAEMHQYTEFIGSHPRMLKGKVAIVASSTVAYGLGRMYQGTDERLPEDIHFEPTVEAAKKKLFSQR